MVHTRLKRLDGLQFAGESEAGHAVRGKQVLQDCSATGQSKTLFVSFRGSRMETINAKRKMEAP